MYDPKNAIRGEDKALLPKDKILDGVIVSIEDGKVKDFIPPGVSWKGDIENPAINLFLEVKVGDEIIKMDQLFTYFIQNEKTMWTPKSNLGKYKAKYDKLPEAGDQVKIITNTDGFGKVKLD